MRPRDSTLRWGSAPRFCFLLIVGLLLALWVTPVAALERRSEDMVTLPADQTVNDDLLITGAFVTVAGHVAGDLYALGNSVTVLPTARIDGDVLVAGNIVNLAGTVGGDVRVAGNTVTIDATIARNLVIVGSQLTLGSGTTVKGNVVGGGAFMTVLGAIDGHLTSGVGQLVLGSTIGKNAELWVDGLTIQPTARIGGRLTYTAPTELAIPATLAATSVQWLPTPTPAPAPPPSATERVLEWLGGTFGLFWLLGTILFGLLLAWLTPGLYRTTAAIIHQRGFVALGIGLVTLIVTPILAVILMISVVGLPVGLLALGTYFASWYVGWLIVAPALAGLTIGLLRTGQPQLAVGWLLTIGLIALHLLTRLPFVGGLLALGVLSLAIGTIVLAVTHRLQRPPTVATTPPTVAIPPTARPALQL